MRFYHYADHAAMLSSIKKSVRPDSQLIIVERISDDGNIRCGEVTRSLADLESRIAENGFKLVKEIPFLHIGKISSFPYIDLS